MQTTQATVTFEPDPTQATADGFKTFSHGGGAILPPDPPTEAPVNVDPPLLSGQPVPGQTLFITLGNWLNLPTSFSGEWQGDGVYLATGAAYNVMATDVGTTVLCVVTATNAAGSTTVSSNSVPITASRRA
jgi:hypothetical protein